MSDTADRDDLVNQPALAERCDGSGPVPGQVVGAYTDGGEDRVNLDTGEDVPLNTERERVRDLSKPVQDLVRIAKSECAEPGEHGDHSSMVGYGALVGQAKVRAGIDRDEVDHVIAAACISDALVRCSDGERTWFVPRDAYHLSMANAEVQNQPDADEGLVEHLRSVTEEVRQS